MEGGASYSEVECKVAGWTSELTSYRNFVIIIMEAIMVIIIVMGCCILFPHGLFFYLCFGKYLYVLASTSYHVSP